MPTWGSTYRNASVDRSALDRMMELTGGVRVSAHVPAVASQQAECRHYARDERHRRSAHVGGRNRHSRRNHQGRKQGQIVITAVLLYATKVLRTGAGLVKVQAQHA